MDVHCSVVSRPHKNEFDERFAAMLLLCAMCFLFDTQGLCVKVFDGAQDPSSKAMIEAAYNNELAALVRATEGRLPNVVKLRSAIPSFIMGNSIPSKAISMEYCGE